jgi:hypothetical protein
MITPHGKTYHENQLEGMTFFAQITAVRGRIVVGAENYAKCSYQDSISKEDMDLLAAEAITRLAMRLGVEPPTSADVGFISGAEKSGFVWFRHLHTPEQDLLKEGDPEFF